MGRVVPFPPPAASGPEPVSPEHPVCHVPSVGGAVEAFFAQRDLAAATCRTYRQALGPLVDALAGDQPVRWRLCSPSGGVPEIVNKWGDTRYYDHALDALGKRQAQEQETQQRRRDGPGLGW